MSRERDIERIARLLQQPPDSLGTPLWRLKTKDWGEVSLEASNPKKRSVFLDRLNHRFIRDIDNRFVWQHPGVDPTTLSKLCYVIAPDEQFDGRFIDASEVPATLASALFGMVVSYIPGQLVVYNDEAPSDPIWLRR